MEAFNCMTNIDWTIHCSIILTKNINLSWKVFCSQQEINHVLNRLKRLYFENIDVFFALLF